MSATKPGLDEKITVDNAQSAGYAWALWERLSSFLTRRDPNAGSVSQSTLPCLSPYRRPILTVFDRFFVDPAAFPAEPEEVSVVYEETEETDEPDPDARNPMRFEFPGWRKFFG